MELEGDVIPSSYLSPSSNLQRKLSRSTPLPKRKTSTRIPAEDTPRLPSNAMGVDVPNAILHSTTNSKPPILTVTTTTTSPTSLYSEHSFKQTFNPPTSAFNKPQSPRTSSLPPKKDQVSSQTKRIPKSRSSKGPNKPLPPTPPQKTASMASTQRAKKEGKTRRLTATNQMVGPKGPVFTSPLLMHSKSFKHLSLQTNFNTLGSVQEVEQEEVFLSNSAPSFTTPTNIQSGLSNGLPPLSSLGDISRTPANSPHPADLSSTSDSPRVVVGKNEKKPLRHMNGPTHHSSLPPLSIRTRMSHAVRSGAVQEVHASYIVSPLSPRPLSTRATLHTFDPVKVAHSTSHSTPELGHISTQLSNPDINLLRSFTSRDAIIRANKARYESSPSTSSNLNITIDDSRQGSDSSASESNLTLSPSPWPENSPPTPLTPFTPIASWNSPSLNQNLTSSMKDSSTSSLIEQKRLVGKLSHGDLLCLIAECSPSHITTVDVINEDLDCDCDCEGDCGGDEECECDDCDEERFDNLKVKGKSVDFLRCRKGRVDWGSRESGWGGRNSESVYTRGEITPLSGMSLDAAGEWGNWALR